MREAIFATLLYEKNTSNFGPVSLTVLGFEPIFLFQTGA